MTIPVIPSASAAGGPARNLAPQASGARFLVAVLLGMTSRARGALLLEVVVALAVLVTAMGLLGAQLAGGLNMTAYSEEQLRASLLADRLLAQVQLDPNMQVLLSESDDFEDKFGDQYPGYYWHVLTEPLNRDKPDDMKVVTLEVLYQPDKELQDSTSGINTALPLRRLGFLKGKPGTLNLVEQAGLSEEAAEGLRQMIPIPGFDPSAVDLQQLMSLLTPDQINQILPMLAPLLQQIGAGDYSGLADMAQQLSGTLGQDVLGGMSPDDLAGAIQQAVGGAGAGSGHANQPPAGRTPGQGPGTTGRSGQTPGTGGGQRGSTPPKSPTPPATGGGASGGGGINIGQGSGPNGEYTLEDLMRLRDAYEQQQGGKK